MAADAGKPNSWAATDPWNSVPKLSQPAAQGFFTSEVRAQRAEDAVLGKVQMEQAVKLLPSCPTGKEDRAEEDASACHPLGPDTNPCCLLPILCPDPMSCCMVVGQCLLGAKRTCIRTHKSIPQHTGGVPLHCPMFPELM